MYKDFRLKKHIPDKSSLTKACWKIEPLDKQCAEHGQCKNKQIHDWTKKANKKNPSKPFTMQPVFICDVLLGPEEAE